MNVMILGGRPESPPAAKPCGTHLELAARMERIEKCVEAIEKALAARQRTRTKTAKPE